MKVLAIGEHNKRKSVLKEAISKKRDLLYSFVENTAKKGKRKSWGLDDKYFDKLDKFKGSKGKFKQWVFQFMVCWGRVDWELKDKLEGLVKVDIWNYEDCSRSEQAKGFIRDSKDKLASWDYVHGRYCQEWEIDQLLQFCRRNFIFLVFARFFKTKYSTKICPS